LRLKWGASGVTVNPELKLLQYDIGKPLVLEETIDYMLEKNGIYLKGPRRKHMENGTSLSHL